MRILKIFPENPNDKFISWAVNALSKGQIVIYPTDTLYAFGCDALNNSAIEKICELKQVKSDKTNLSIICRNIAQAAEYARINNKAFQIMRKNLPGPFTFILPALSKLPKAFKGRKTVGIRIPENNITKALVEELGHPIMTASVPFVDEDEGTEAELIAQNYNNSVELVIDGGRGNTLPSTVVSCLEDNFEIIRQGKGILAL